MLKISPSGEAVRAKAHCIRCDAKPTWAKMVSLSIHSAQKMGFTYFLFCTVYVYMFKDSSRIQSNHVKVRYEGYEGNHSKQASNLKPKNQSETLPTNQSWRGSMNKTNYQFKNLVCSLRISPNKKKTRPSLVASHGQLQPTATRGNQGLAISSLKVSNVGGMLVGYNPHRIHGTIVYLPIMMWLIFWVNLSKCTVRPMGMDSSPVLLPFGMLNFHNFDTALTSWINEKNKWHVSELRTGPTGIVGGFKKCCNLKWSLACPSAVVGVRSQLPRKKHERLVTL